MKEIAIDQVVIRPAAKGATSAGYFRIRNHLTAADVLVGASCDCARVVEVHRMLHEGLTMKMVPVSEVAIPAGSEVRFEPHGLHLMLIDLPANLVAGMVPKLTLTFRSGRTLTLPARVGEP